MITLTIRHTYTAFSLSAFIPIILLSPFRVSQISFCISHLLDSTPSLHYMARPPCPDLTWFRAHIMPLNSDLYFHDVDRPPIFTCLCSTPSLVLLLLVLHTSSRRRWLWTLYKFFLFFFSPTMDGPRYTPHLNRVNPSKKRCTTLEYKFKPVGVLVYMSTIQKISF